MPKNEKSRYSEHSQKLTHSLYALIVIEILHFNDVYNLEGKQADKTPVNDDWEVMASAGRFKTAFDVYNSKEKLVVFSGDLFFPSIRK